MPDGVEPISVCPSPARNELYLAVADRSPAQRHFVGRLDLHTGAYTSLAAWIPKESRKSAVPQLAISPDGKHLRLSIERERPAPPALILVDLETGRLTRIETLALASCWVGNRLLVSTAEPSATQPASTTSPTTAPAKPANFWINADGTGKEKWPGTGKVIAANPSGDTILTLDNIVLDEKIEVWGRLVTHPRSHDQIRVFDKTGKELFSKILDRRAGPCAISPSGKVFCYTEYLATDGGPDAIKPGSHLYVHNLDGSRSGPIFLPDQTAPRAIFDSGHVLTFTAPTVGQRHIRARLWLGDQDWHDIGQGLLIAQAGQTLYTTTESKNGRIDLIPISLPKTAPLKHNP